MTETASNVDPKEIEKFNLAADHWWDLKGEFGALHKINPLRSDFIQEHAGRPKNSDLTGIRLLDIGCGGGILSEEMARRGAQVTAIDLSESALQQAEQHAIESRLTIEYKHLSAEALAAEVIEGKRPAFDVVTCMEMLEHVPDPASIVNAIGSLCATGGNAFFATINRKPKSYALMILAAEYIANMVPRGTHEYAKFIRPSELVRWARDAGLETCHSAGITYNPITREFRFDAHDLDVNYMLHCKKL